MKALLAAIFGGVVIGIGIGLVFLGNGSTGGTALAAKIINKYTGLTLGTCLAMMDGLIVLAAMTVFELKRGCTRSLVCLFLVKRLMWYRLASVIQKWQ
ncbi:hypothetical protein BsIDN1_61960 [Bacillus safensis]|uniref:Uncharacterized protein n=1 Tax=Bacillus safensis TaxID=561879 RepID=A0A5S9MHM5_BACIA|nr:hypothetical protein BsIDN1_61960 [Bacillus safensis]